MRSTNYYDNKLKKNPQIYIYNNKMMFSTSAPFFNPGSSGKDPDSSNSGNPADPDVATDAANTNPNTDPSAG